MLWYQCRRDCSLSLCSEETSSVWVPAITTLHHWPVYYILHHWPVYYILHHHYIIDQCLTHYIIITSLTSVLHSTSSLHHWPVYYILTHLPIICRTCGRFLILKSTGMVFEVQVLSSLLPVIPSRRIAHLLNPLHSWRTTIFRPIRDVYLSVCIGPGVSPRTLVGTWSFYSKSWSTWGTATTSYF